MNEKHFNKNETFVKNEIRKELGGSKFRGERIWSSPRGMAFVGSLLKRAGDVFTVKGRQMSFGLSANGSHDFVGVKSHIVRPEDVGRKVGIIVFIEAKRPSWKAPKSGKSVAYKRFCDQLGFRDLIRSLGGLSGFATSAEEARRIVSGGEDAVDS